MNAHRPNLLISTRVHGLKRGIQLLSLHVEKSIFDRECNSRSDKSTTLRCAPTTTLRSRDAAALPSHDDTALPRRHCAPTTTLRFHDEKMLRSRDDAPIAVPVKFIFRIHQVTEQFIFNVFFFGGSGSLEVALLH